MILDRSHLKWAVGSAIVVVAAGARYLNYARTWPGGPTGGTPDGLAFGGLALAMIVMGVALSARRMVPSWRLGCMETWLRAHIWLTLCSIPIVFFHTGFRMGHGSLTRLVMAVYGVVSASGVLGLFIQQVMPQRITLTCPLEAVYAQIDKILSDLVVEARLMVDAIAGPVDQARMTLAVAVAGTRPGTEPVPGAEALPLLEFYVQQVRPYLDGRPSSLEKEGLTSTAFDRVRTVVPPDLHATVDGLEMLCEERRQLLVQTKQHRVLHRWLFVHVPLSTLLLALVAVHAVQSMRY